LVCKKGADESDNEVGLQRKYSATAANLTGIISEVDRKVALSMEGIITDDRGGTDADPEASAVSYPVLKGRQFGYSCLMSL